MKTLLLALIVLVPAGAYPVRIPIEGLTAQTGAELKSKIEAHYKTIAKPDTYYRVEVSEAKDGVLVMWSGCNTGHNLDDIRAAIKDSSFSIKTDDWEVVGKVTLRWKTDATAADIEKSLEKFGTVEATLDKGTATARVILGEKKTHPLKDLLVVAGGATLSWDNENVKGENVRMECGARRIKADK